MINGMEKFLSSIMPAHHAPVSQPIAKPQISSNPFANPFLSQNLEQLNRRNELYGKNNPSPTGYFAGYHNGKPNIVGKRLFVEV